MNRGATCMQPARPTARLFLMAIGTPANGRGSPGPIAVGLRERVLGEHVDERVERRVELVDAVERAWTSSRAVSSPERTSAASSVDGAEEQVGAGGSGHGPGRYPEPSPVPA